MFASLKVVLLALAGLVVMLIGLLGMRNRNAHSREIPTVGSVEDYYDEDYTDDLDEDVDYEDDYEPEAEDIEEDPLFQEPRVEQPYEPVEEVIAILILAKEDTTFVGYELLQAILANGLRFGDMNIFHRFQEKNGHGPLIFSLASATEPGTFDIDNMGAANCVGLTLFMRCSGSHLDLPRFNLLLETTKQLAEELDGDVCNQQQELLSQAAINNYRNQLMDVTVTEELIID